VRAATMPTSAPARIAHSVCSAASVGGEAAVRDAVQR
jgi:hypothetical protein